MPRSHISSADARQAMPIISNSQKPRALGRKVSDEFTVPLCREHHLQLHQHGNEAAWWANLKIAPLEMAKELWNATLGKSKTAISVWGC